MQIDTPIEYEIGDRQRLIFASGVLQVFARFRQDVGWKREAGGQLFAKLSENMATIQLATTPNSKDFRSRFQFIPFLKIQQQQIDEQFTNGLHFVGDWHTHPQEIPKMSITDRQSMSECFMKSAHNLNSFVMVIVGTAPFPKGLSVSLHNEFGINIAKLAD